MTNARRIEIMCTGADSVKSQVLNEAISTAGRVSAECANDEIERNEIFEHACKRLHNAIYGTEM